MALSFARDFYGPETSFTPLFRLLSDWDAYTQETNNKGPSQNRRVTRTFMPKFDIREVDNAFELHGELPGIARDDVSIEFTDPQTIVIRGHVERNYTSSSPNGGAIENGKTAGAITEQGESHKATVEDEKPEDQRDSDNTVAKKDSGAAATTKQQKPKERYLIQERSYGEFSRTFSIPTPIDHDAVHASFKDGVLTVVLPKAKKHQTRRIAIH